MRDVTNARSVDVAMVAEGTYPYVAGGVSSVIHQLITHLSELRFGVIHLAWDEASPRARKYDVPPNVAWVRTIYLSPAARRRAPDRSGSAKAPSHDSVRTTIAAVEATLGGNFEPLLQIPPNELRAGLASPELMQWLQARFRWFGISLADLFWLQREFSSLAMSLLDNDFPHARVYHSHTCGYGAVVAALAARRNNAHFALSEHSLYARDAIASLSTGATPDLSTTGLAGASQERDLSRRRREAWCAWFRALCRFAYERADRTTYLYARIRDEARGYGSDPRRARIIPNGVESAQFEVARRRATPGKPKGARWRIGFIGRVVPIKGVLDLIEAARTLRDEGPDFELEIIGPCDEDPAYADACRARIEFHGLCGRVSLLGSQRTAEALERLDLVVLASHSEALPLVVVESMAAAVPVISTDVGGVRGVLVEGDEPGGETVPPRQPQALGRAIASLLRDSARLAAYAAHGPRRVERRFRQEIVLEEFRKLYRNLGKEEFAHEKVDLGVFGNPGLRIRDLRPGQSAVSEQAWALVPPWTLGDAAAGQPAADAAAAESPR